MKKNIVSSKATILMLSFFVICFAFNAKALEPTDGGTGKTHSCAIIVSAPGSYSASCGFVGTVCSSKDDCSLPSN